MKSILWVEDEDRHYYLFSHELKDIYLLTYARDYKAAKEKFQEKYDLIVIDIILPSGIAHKSEADIDDSLNIYYGLELIKEIREIDKIIPIIVLTVVNEVNVWEKIRNIDKNIIVKWKYETDPIDFKNIINKLLFK